MTGFRLSLIKMYPYRVATFIQFNGALDTFELKQEFSLISGVVFFFLIILYVARTTGNVPIRGVSLVFNRMRFQVVYACMFVLHINTTCTCIFINHLIYKKITFNLLQLLYTQCTKIPFQRGVVYISYILLCTASSGW